MLMRLPCFTRMLANEPIECEWPPKPLALNHSKTENLIICEKYLLNKLSLNRNTYKTRFCVDWLMKTLWSEAQRNLTLDSPRNNGSLFTNSGSV